MSYNDDELKIDDPAEDELDLDLETGIDDPLDDDLGTNDDEESLDVPEFAGLDGSLY